MLCWKCFSETRETKRPPKDQLLNDIFSMPMTQVAEKYKVTSPAVKKWLIYYNLPFRTAEIRKLKETY